MKSTIKSFFVLVISVLFCTPSIGQITLMPSDLPVIGKTYQMLRDTNTSLPVITPGSTTAQNWDFSNAFPNIRDTITWNFVDKTTLPGHANFPTAIMGFNNKQDSVYVYLYNDTDGLYVDGSYTYFSLAPNTAIVLNPRELFFPVNFTYNSTRTHSAKSTVFATAMGFDVKLVTRITSTFTGDAFGSLKTPTGTYADVLRVKRQRIQQDSIYVKFGLFYVPFQTTIDTTFNYSFYEKNPNHALVCNVDMDRENPNKSKRASYSRTLSVGIQEKNNSIPQITAYPNPVQDYLNISLTALPNVQTFILYDITGKELIRENLSGLHHFSVFTGHLPQGIYTYHLFNKNNENIGWGKCIH
jgi:hypothetical protein